MEWMVFASINSSRVATISFPHILVWDDSPPDLTLKFPKVLNHILVSEPEPEPKLLGAAS
jgi:hypothetical protein